MLKSSCKKPSSKADKPLPLGNIQQMDSIYADIPHFLNSVNSIYNVCINVQFLTAVPVSRLVSKVVFFCYKQSQSD